jgi:hypothetical protein
MSGLYIAFSVLLIVISARTTGEPTHIAAHFKILLSKLSIPGDKKNTSQIICSHHH